MKSAIQSFRVSLPNTATPQAPVSVKISSMSNRLVFLYMMTNAVPDISVTGFRVKSAGVIVLPQSGSKDTIASIGSAEGWAPLPPQELRLPVSIDLPGPPFEAEIQFYNVHASASYLIGGFLVSQDVEYDINDLIREMSREHSEVMRLYRENTNHNAAQYKTG